MALESIDKIIVFKQAGEHRSSTIGDIGDNVVNTKKELINKRVAGTVNTVLIPKNGSIYDGSGTANSAYKFVFPNVKPTQFSLYFGISDWSGQNTFEGVFRGSISSSGVINYPSIEGVKNLKSNSIITQIYNSFSTYTEDATGKPVLIVGDISNSASKVYWSYAYIDKIVLSYSYYNHDLFHTEGITLSTTTDLTGYTLQQNITQLNIQDRIITDDNIKTIANEQTTSAYRSYNYVFHKYVIGNTTDYKQIIKFQHNEDVSAHLGFDISFSFLYIGRYVFNIGFYLSSSTKTFYNPTVRVSGKIEQDITVTFIKGTDGFYYICFEGFKRGNTLSTKYCTAKVYNMDLGVTGNTVTKHYFEDKNNWDYYSGTTLPATTNSAASITIVAN